MRSDHVEPVLRWAYLAECDAPPNGWVVEPFQRIADVIAGQSPPSDTYNEKGNGLPFLQGNGDFSSLSPVPTLWCSAPVKTARQGDTLISVRAPVGEVNRADRDYAIGRGLAAVRARGCDPNFLHQAIQRWRWCLQRVAQGTTFDAVTARHFAQLRVTLPAGANEQAAIARILDALDAAMEHTKTAAERARDVKRSVLNRFFYDALGETAYADRPRKELPAGWSLVAAELLLAEEPKNGVSPEASSQPPGTPTFSIAAIRDGRVDLVTQSNIKYTRISDAVARRFRIHRGDILIVRGNANPDLVGKAGVVSEFPEGCIYPDIAKRVVLRTGDGPTVSPEFAVVTWNHALVHNQVLRRAKTSNGTLKINNRDVTQVVMPVPPRSEQKHLVEAMAAIDASIDALGAIGTAQAQLKRGLMQELLTGRVRVGYELRGAS